MSAGELLLAVARLRAVWPVLADAMTPGRTRTGRVRDVNPAADLVYLARRAVLDRQARFVALRDNTVPKPPMHDAANARALDARTLVDRAVSDVAPEAYRAAFGRPLPARWWTPDPVDAGRAATTGTRVPAGLDAITAAAGHITHAPLLAGYADRLDQAATAAEQVTELAAAYLPLGWLDCPGCGLATLRARIDSPQQAEWVIECRNTGCGCTGPRCGCGRALGSRLLGRRHVWAPGEWPRLCDVLGLTGEKLRAMLTC